MEVGRLRSLGFLFLEYKRETGEGRRVSRGDMKQVKRELWEFLIWGIHCGVISAKIYIV